MRITDVITSTQLPIDAGIICDTAPKLAPINKQATAVPPKNMAVSNDTWDPLFSPVTNGARTSHECPHGFTP